MDDDRFYVKSLTLENFRCFENTELGPFDPHLNLLVGTNGSGKSSVLLALASLFRQLASHELDDARRPLTHLRDIKFVNEISADGLVHKQYRFGAVLRAKYDWCGDGQIAQEQITGEPMGPEGQLFREGGDGTIPLSFVRRDDKSKNTQPILVMYTVRRGFFGVMAGDGNFENLAFNRVGAFWAWSSPSTYSNYFLEWLKDQTLFSLQADKRNFGASAGLTVTRATRQLALLKDALNKIDEDIIDVTYDASVRDAVVEYRAGRFEFFSQFSDGRRSFIGLVADLVRRVCYLNADSLGAQTLKETNGLVLIDEIDLHLHPKWQRQIVGALKRIFPRIQFFATTHSPQVIGEARPEEIVLLTKDGQQRRPPASYGMDSNWILECVMEAEGRDPTIAKRIKSLFKLIDEDRFADAKVEIANLREIIDGDPELVAAEAYIWNLEQAPDEAAE